MRCTVRTTTAFLLAATIAVAGCKQEQTGDLSNRDLGTEGRVLVPTGMTLTDAGVSKGSAQWQKLRAPEFGSSVRPSGEATGTADTAEPEEVLALRELIADFNVAVAAGNYTDLSAFLVEAQVEPIEKLVEIVPALATKALELNAALPAPNVELGKAVESMALTKLFHLDVGAIKMSSESSGTGELTHGGVAVVKFALEGEDWYFEHPMVASVTSSIGELEQGGGVLDQAIAGLGSGSLTGPAVDETVDSVLDLLMVFMPVTSGTPADSGETVGT